MTVSKKKRKRSDTTTKWERCKAYFGYRCAYCGKAGKLTKDHVIPRHYGGPDMVFNIIPACQSCNSSKGKRNAGQWYRQQPFYSMGREVRIKMYLFNTCMNL
ncbi:HNH endonuclease [Dysgonomonas sp. GY75]|uniref:HNH endonuclease n=1 Tax=Dysgonomonas sp. GY75 TaxID=2780419 RepID=UPI0018841877|nr:HNH endonuclease [Dysgonomonas sp. GY75]